MVPDLGKHRVILRPSGGGPVSHSRHRDFPKVRQVCPGLGQLNVWPDAGFGWRDLRESRRSVAARSSAVGREPATPRVPSSISDPGAGTQCAWRRARCRRSRPLAPLTEVPLYGTLDLPASAEDGPPNGLSFDQAWSGCSVIHLEPRSPGSTLRDPLGSGRRDHGEPSREPDPLRRQPVDPLREVQQYRSARAARLQYDFNISQPIDYSRKRSPRVAVATKTRKAVEFQYQDAVRVQIGNLANAYVAVVAARETFRYTEAGLRGLERVLDATRKLQKVQRPDQRRCRTVRGSDRLRPRSASWTALEALRNAKVALGGYLNLPPEQGRGDRDPRLAPQASSRESHPFEELAKVALTCRPDVNAYRAGVNIARSSLGLAVQANRFADAYLLYQPYTFQNLSYLGNSPGRDLLGAGDHGPSAGLQPQPGQHRTGEDQHRAVPDPARGRRADGHHRGPRRRAGIPRHQGLPRSA